MDTRSKFGRLAVPCLVLAAFCLYLLFSLSGGQRYAISKSNNGPVEHWCPLPEPHPPVQDGLGPSSYFSEEASVLAQVERLSAAVNVPTVSYDDNGEVDEDPRSSSYLKPIVFTAHQDVVPAGSPSKWTHPPFSAYHDGRFLWGRGSSDCKNNLIGLLSVVEKLLDQGWSPKRTIILAFGFDEETGGQRGAKHIGTELENRYGRNGIAMVMDEGGMGIETIGKIAYALPAVAEKGYIDIILTVETPGGHSSRPPRHSGIGFLAEMIVELENNPFKPRLTRENPFRGFLECQVRHSPHEVEPWLRRGLEKGEDEALLGMRLAEARGNEARYSIQTSQAVDVVKGGDKTNQLPETVTAIVNIRIAPHDSVAIVKSRIRDLLTPIAHSHKLSVKGFGAEEEDAEAGSLTLHSRDDLQPAPLSPTDLDNSVWHIFSGTIRHVFEDTESLKHKTVVPVGDIMTDNTDTIHYWNLSRNIYRYSPARAGTRLGVHTVDERLDMSAHLEGMRLYYDLMRNFDRFEDV